MNNQTAVKIAEFTKDTRKAMYKCSKAYGQIPGSKNSFDIEKCLAQNEFFRLCLIGLVKIPLILKSVQHARVCSSSSKTIGKNSFDIEKCLAPWRRLPLRKVKVKIPLILKSVQHQRQIDLLEARLR